jgi:hypothetical protein
MGIKPRTGKDAKQERSPGPGLDFGSRRRRPLLVWANEQIEAMSAEQLEAMSDAVGSFLERYDRDPSRVEESGEVEPEAPGISNTGFTWTALYLPGERTGVARASSLDTSDGDPDPILCRNIALRDLVDLARSLAEEQQATTDEMSGYPFLDDEDDEDAEEGDEEGEDGEEEEEEGWG